MSPEPCCLYPLPHGPQYFKALPVVQITEADISDKDGLVTCAICLDDFVVRSQGPACTRLPALADGPVACPSLPTRSGWRPGEAPAVPPRVPHRVPASVAGALEPRLPDVQARSGIAWMHGPRKSRAGLTSPHLVGCALVVTAHLVCCHRTLQTSGWSPSRSARRRRPSAAWCVVCPGRLCPQTATTTTTVTDAVAGFGMGNGQVAIEMQDLATIQDGGDDEHGDHDHHDDGGRAAGPASVATGAASAGPAADVAAPVETSAGSAGASSVAPASLDAAAPATPRTHAVSPIESGPSMNLMSALSETLLLIVTER